MRQLTLNVPIQAAMYTEAVETIQGQRGLVVLQQIGGAPQFFQNGHFITGQSYPTLTTPWTITLCTQETVIQQVAQTQTGTAR